jgi:hypothetical protein
MSPALHAENRYALKEWAVVVRALAEGRQTLVFRKGGILEEAGEFRVEHSEFFLYPTYLHEQAERVVPAAAADLRAVMAEKPPGERVGLSVYAAVREAVRITDFERLKGLRPHHIFSDGEIENRFHYRQRPGLFVLLLRVYRLPRPFWLPVTRAYAGCRSWVDLETHLSTKGTEPAIPDVKYDNLIKEIKNIIQVRR